jgi:hypothetical protein
MLWAEHSHSRHSKSVKTFTTTRDLWLYCSFRVFCPHETLESVLDSDPALALAVPLGLLLLCWPLLRAAGFVGLFCPTFRMPPATAAGIDCGVLAREDRAGPVAASSASALEVFSSAASDSWTMLLSSASDCVADCVA